MQIRYVSACRLSNYNLSTRTIEMLAMKSKLLTGFLILLQFSPTLAFPTPHGRAPCTNIAAPQLPGAQTLSVSGRELGNVSLSPAPGVPPTPSNLSVCEDNITLTHPGEKDKVLVQTWLPLGEWNGRFQGVGGGGLATGMGTSGLGVAAQLGYCASQTDGGHFGDPFNSDWALTEDGEVNCGLLTNFASRSLHDMAVVGKQVTRSYYGRPPNARIGTGVLLVVDRGTWKHSDILTTTTVSSPTHLRSTGTNSSQQRTGLRSSCIIPRSIQQNASLVPSRMPASPSAMAWMEQWTA